MVQQPVLDQDFLATEASRSNSDTQHLVGLTLTNDQPEAENSIWQYISTTLSSNRYACTEAIRTRNPKKLAAGVSYLRPRLHWVQPKIIIIIITIIIISGSTGQRRLWPPRPRGFLITHNDAPHSVGLLWTSDQLVAETSTWQYTNVHAPGGLRTNDRSRRADVDLRIRPRAHWARPAENDTFY
jgi:hypothetical protein